MSNTNNDVLYWWVLAVMEMDKSSPYTMRNGNGTLSIRNGNDLYSYELQIGTIDPATRTALILPHSSSTATTNRHISGAAAHANNSLNLVHVFQLPELTFDSPENKHYLCEMLNNARTVMLNKRRQYKARHNAVEHWHEVMLDIINYNECLSAHGMATIPTDPEGAIHILENEGGTNFLGQSALEGDIHQLHRLDEHLQEALESSNG